MNTLVFDHDGNCLFAMNYLVEAEDYPTAGKVVHSEAELSPNDMWYDFEKNRMDNKTPFEVTVTTNTIAGLPEGTIAEIEGSEVVVDGGSLELVTSVPQTAVVNLRHPRHYPLRVEVVCEV